MGIELVKRIDLCNFEIDMCGTIICTLNCCPCEEVNEPIMCNSIYDINGNKLSREQLHDIIEQQERMEDDCK